MSCIDFAFRLSALTLVTLGLLKYKAGLVLLKARQKEQGDDEAQGVDDGTFIKVYVIYYFNTCIRVTIIEFF